MKRSFQQFGGYSAILVGILSLVYAVFYLVVSRQNPSLGVNASWIVLALSGIFSSAAYVALYQLTQDAAPGAALWALALGAAASLATLLHGAYESTLIKTIAEAGPAQQAALAVLQQAPSQVDPAGIMAFFITGVVSLIFNYLIVNQGVLPKALGTLGIVNGFVASANHLQILILISGGLTSVILGPIWWIWLGIKLSQSTL